MSQKSRLYLCPLPHPCLGSYYHGRRVRDHHHHPCQGPCPSLRPLPWPRSKPASSANSAPSSSSLVGPLPREELCLGLGEAAGAAQTATTEEPVTSQRGPPPCSGRGSPKTPRPLSSPNPAAASFRTGLNPLCHHSPPDLGSPLQQLQPQELHPLQPHLPQLPPDTCRVWNLRCGLRCSAGHPAPRCCLPRITRSAQRPGPLLCPSCLQDPSTRASSTSVALRPEGQEARLTPSLPSLCHHTPGYLGVLEEPCLGPLAPYHPPACSRCPRTSRSAPSL